MTEEQPVFVKMTEKMLYTMLRQASQQGAYNAMRLCGVKTKERLTRSDLQRMYGTGLVNKLISSGKLTPQKLSENGKPFYTAEQVISILI